MVSRQSVLYIVGQVGTENQFLPHLQQHYSVSVARIRRQTLHMLEENTPDIIVIDVPSIRFSLERLIEAINGLAAASNLFLVLEKGTRLDHVPKAQGYIRYPTTPRQLCNRLSRMIPVSKGHTLSWHDLKLNTDGRFLLWEDRKIPVTPKQAALIKVFIAADEELLTRAYLMQTVWGTNYLGDTRTLDVHIHWLRKALKSLNAPFQIKTERGKGYRLIKNKS